MSLDPENHRLYLFSGFVQDEVAVSKDRLVLTMGSKFEHNDYTGLEIQPSLRLLARLHPRHTLWAAVSRAVRIPSIVNESMRFNLAAFPGEGGLTNVLAYFGNPRLDSERLLAYELGYRAQASKRFSLDVAAFYNLYHDLPEDEFGVPFLESSPAPPHLVLPIQPSSQRHGANYGTELDASYAPVSFWKVSGGYSWLRSQSAPGEDPKHQFHVRSYLSLPRNFEFDTNLSYVAPLTAWQVPSYTRLDTRVGWRATENLECSLAFQNLLDPRRQEFTSEFGLQGAGQIQRSIYGKITWRF